MTSNTMIRGGGIVNINNSSLNMVNDIPNRDRALELLRSNCSLAALVDADQRYDPPRCAETTRREIIQKLEDWVRGDPHDAPSVFWLHGGAGVGKSALAQTLSEKFKLNDDLAASFFFFKTDVNRNDGNRLIPTLTLQLVRSFERLTPIVERIILRNPDLFKKNRQTQLLELLVEPLIRLSLEETNDMPMQSNLTLQSHPRLVVIDGLDECADWKIQCDLLRILDRAIPHFPYPLRFLITSRPEAHITRAFQYSFSNVTVVKYNLSNDSDADNDIRNFLDAEFAQIRCTHPLRQHLPSPWPSPGDINPIVERSSAHFVYASTVIRFIQSPKHRPEDRLQVILGLREPYEKERPYAALDLLYSLIFLSVQDPSQLEKIYRAFGIMHLRSRNVGLFSSPQWTSDQHAIETLLELRPGDLELVFDPLLSLVTFEKNDIRSFHKSLFDYLLDSSRSGDLHLDLGLAFECAATRILQKRKFQDGWDLEEFEDFTYHCQFARLNDTLKGHLRALVGNPESKFTESLSRLLGSSKRSSVLTSILHSLQVIGRKDFDSSGRCYKEYVKKENQYLRSVVPWTQRLKCIFFCSMHLDLTLRRLPLEDLLCTMLRYLFPIDLQGLGQRNKTGFNGRDPLPFTNRPANGPPHKHTEEAKEMLSEQPTKTSGKKRTVLIVDRSIELEHKMLSSYVKVHHPFPAIFVSYLEPVEETKLIHSCHFAIRDVSVTFLMLVTYTAYGIRLSLTRYERLISLRSIDWRNSVKRFVSDHFKRTQEAVNEIQGFQSFLESGGRRPF